MDKTMSDGRTLEMTAEQGQIRVTLAGKDLGLGRIVIIDIRKEVAAYVNTNPKIGLTQDEMDTLKAELTAQPSEPLKRTYEMIGYEIDSLYDEQAQMTRAYGQGQPLDSSIKARIKALYQEMAEYRESHPEEMAQREAEKEAKERKALKHIWD